MTSTFSNYRIYSSDLQKSLARVAAEPRNAKDQAYFEANIGQVKSVDGFLNNYRLFSYAMNAYGLQDLGNAKALMKKVLESDLSDANSFARRLNDSRYTAFAKAFAFTTTGSVASTGSVQTASQQQDLFSRMGVSASEASDLGTTIAAIGSVTAFEANTSLYTRTLAAFGLDAKTVTKQQVAAALQSNLSDPFSVANISDSGKAGTNAKIRAMAADFNFASDGTVGSQTQVQSAPDIAATLSAYVSKLPADSKAQAAGATESAYYAKTMPTLTSADQIVANPRLVAVLKTAFGLPANTTPAQIRSVLASNLLDPKSAANSLGIGSAKASTSGTSATSASTAPAALTGYQILASVFNIGTDGKPWDHSLAVTPASLTSIAAAYTTATTPAASLGKDAAAKAVKAAETETAYFSQKMANLDSVGGLLSDSRLVAYVRTAFALPAPVAATGSTAAVAGTSADALASILKSNLLDPASAANTMGAAARNLATAFNFAPDGLVYAQRPIQSAASVTTTTTAYQSAAGSSTAAKAAAQTETDYYTSTLPRVKSVDDLLSDSRLVAYVTKAFNLPATQTSTLRQVLTSNLADPTSKANRLGGVYETLAAAFDISPDGSITHTPDQQVQTKSGIVATHAAYLEQMMETEAGDQYGTGVRLALYFRNVAPTITNAYGILADKSLTSVVQTMLGLSTTSSKADIDTQARYIASKINVADFKNPQKLDKMIGRFSALYDLTNASSSTTSSVASLFV